MRILLVTWTDQFLAKLQILNPELEYCAIVVDEVEPAKKILEQVGLSKELLYPFYELKECVKNFYYDYIVCLENYWDATALSTKLNEYEVQNNKILNVAPNVINNFLLERSLRYFKEHVAEFDMFATGISYVEAGLDVTRFKHKLFNFGRGSQDLYYNFKVAKFALSCGGGHNKFCYALIGLAPYTFHYDQTKTHNPLNHCRLWQYLIAFNDLHNFYAPIEDCKKIFRTEYLNAKLHLEPFDINNPYMTPKVTQRFMTPQNRLEARKTIDAWNKKYFLETRAENIKILDDYLTLCEENNILPIMFLPPMTKGYEKYFSRQILNEFYYLIEQACQKHSSAIFIDGWKLQGLTDTDFHDVDHLNHLGATKFSSFLNDFIESL
ncbi:MAG: hypothetical protein IKZ53_08490 [Selenomonadaceae bacterium]|nr:hypothetical protein [Selenomonadaceae bacterium]